MKKEKFIIELAEAVGSLPNAKVARDFLSDILTPQEFEDIALRWQIVKALYKGVTQREVAKKLHVSLCKVTRGSRELKYGHKGFQYLMKNYE